MDQKISIILPAFNEGPVVGRVVRELKHNFPDAEVIVVDDCSVDNTVVEATDAGARVIRHLHNMGNGAAIKTGARHAHGDILVFMDADGQHDPNDVSRLLEKLDEGYDLVVGAREAESQASLVRRVGNHIYNRIASLMTGFPIQDLTSGFRAVRARHFLHFLYLLPNGFSYPTTSTMAFLRSGFPLAYVPIKAAKREGTSHIKLLRDGIKFFLIILKIGALFSPMRFFLPVSMFLFILGLSHYGYTYTTQGRFTNMSALLFISSLLTFLIGMLSEQISALHYKQAESQRRVTKRDSSSLDEA